MTEQVLKHQRIAGVLAREIHSGALEPGSRLPGEHALTRRFAVSRNTVRQALDELSKRGLISTHAGVGSFVTFDGGLLDNRLGWTRALADQGARVSTEVLRLEAVRDERLAGELGIEGAEFLALDRLRILSEGTPVSLERSRVPLLPALADVPLRGLVDGSLTKTLAAAGVRATHGDEWASVSGLDADQAALLRRAEGDLFLRTRRVSRGADGRVVEHVTSLLDPARFQLHLGFGEPPG
ncbi:GntR family transcriptional regulator [Streptomyces botrytidirepellens]|uniref:GntR family transcriptional regulator n=1 Tax=Streptomyces botrytidirepellens TaxID=2486417 RepID=A0A3M8VT97_9ACTN|nr:GntR family transcriptional regulator [Streptomyces botrytidirepellens]RNG20690.1 GntR family transcriptional regulator [Streptomyces botrytidirepellens]